MGMEFNGHGSADDLVRQCIRWIKVEVRVTSGYAHVGRLEGGNGGGFVS